MEKKYFSDFLRTFYKRSYKTLVFLLSIIFFHIIFTPYEGSLKDLYDRAEVFLEEEKKIYLKKIKSSDNKNDDLDLIENFKENYLSFERFEKRDNNLWLNLLYLRKYLSQINSSFFIKEDIEKLFPQPKYPIISFILKFYYKYHLFPPSNFVHIAETVRKNMGAGILIRSKPKLLYKKQKEDLIRKTWKKEFNNLREELSKIYKLTFYKLDKDNSFESRSSFREEVYYLNYFNFSDFEKLFFQKKKKKDLDKYYKVKIVYNKRSSEAFNVLEKKIDLVDYKSPKHYFSEFILHEENIYSMEKEDWDKLFNRILQKISKIYTIQIRVQKEGKLLKESRSFFPQKISEWDNLFLRKYKEEDIQELSLYESKILKYRPNFRKYGAKHFITQKVRNAFVLVEDDYFYFQFAGIDLIGLMKASYEYLFHQSKKGYASINEQIYEMYLGKQSKTPFDKLKQIFGAIYLTYFSPNRTDILDLYIHSIPGSYWKGGHNYGVKNILESYLNKKSVQELTNTELLWISRIASLPNLIGQDYARYLFLKSLLKDLKENQKDSSSLFDMEDLLIKSLKNKLEERKGIYANVKKRLQFAAKSFKRGNAIIKPIISNEEYQELLKEDPNFYLKSHYINEYQSYTDQTLKELESNLGLWALNIGLDIQVEFDFELQKIIETNLKTSSESLGYLTEKKLKDNPFLTEEERNTSYQDHGGGAVLVKTHDIKEKKILNKIVAIASHHPLDDNSYFNWAVEGNRNFGSIIKWLILGLYIDLGGTLLDSYYDIPRAYPYLIKKAKSPGGQDVYGDYIPDNWKRNTQDIFGFYSYELENNVTNFLQSKNNTFVKIAQNIGLEKLADFLNNLAGFNKELRDSLLAYDPIYPIAVGSQEVNNVRFAQMNSIIPNDGILQPLTTIHKIIFGNKTEIIPNFNSSQKRMLTQESAQITFLAGKLNTYYGTAKKFIQGGIGKTGSSDTDVSFLGMTGRTPDQWVDEGLGLKDAKEYLLNNNILYLVNLGVNTGKIAKGLYGGKTAAYNARFVFNSILKDYHFLNTGKKEIAEVSGDFYKYASPYLDYKEIKKPPLKIKGKPVLIPFKQGEVPQVKENYSLKEITAIQSKYIDYVEKKMFSQIQKLVKQQREIEEEQQKGKFKEDYTHFFDFFQKKDAQQAFLEEQLYFLQQEKESLFEMGRDLNEKKQEESAFKKEDIKKIVPSPPAILNPSIPSKNLLKKDIRSGMTYYQNQNRGLSEYTIRKEEEKKNLFRMERDRREKRGQESAFKKEDIKRIVPSPPAILNPSIPSKNLLKKDIRSGMTNYQNQNRGLSEYAVRKEEEKKNLFRIQSNRREKRGQESAFKNKDETKLVRSPRANRKPLVPSRDILKKDIRSGMTNYQNQNRGLSEYAVRKEEEKKNLFRIQSNRREKRGQESAFKNKDETKVVAAPKVKQEVSPRDFLEKMENVEKAFHKKKDNNVK